MESILIFLCCIASIQGYEYGDKLSSVKNVEETSSRLRNVGSWKDNGGYNILLADLVQVGKFINKETEKHQQKNSTSTIALQDDDVSEERYYNLRSTEIARLKNTSETHPYPHKYNTTISLQEFVEIYSNMNDGDLLDNVTLSLAGRIINIRKDKDNVVYYDIRNDGQVIQVLATHKSHETDKYKRGDIIGCTGHPGKTKYGQLTIVPKYLKLLSPCLHKLPTNITDEVKYDKRYLDLILNDNKSKRIFKTRAKIISYIRRFLDNMGFLEVETPILGRIPGVATAKPFKTHNDFLNKDYFLRMSPELYHKMLVIGGMERVYEIGRQFRNEIIDSTHNLEFTTCEFHMAYADYNDLMDITEKLLSSLVKNIHGSYKVKHHPNGPLVIETEIDFKPPYARVPVINTLEKLLNVTFPPANTLHTPTATKFLSQLCEKHKVNVTPPRTSARMLDRLLSDFIQVRIFKPTFIIDYPQIMSPLAKEHREKPGLTERFELYIMKKEVCNAYTEQNDPVVQRNQLSLQDLDRKGGDVEIPPIDEDFIKALEYGLPPTAGWSAGIDRLTMLLTDSQKAKEVVLFPAEEVKRKNNKS